MNEATGILFHFFLFWTTRSSAFVQTSWSFLQSMRQLRSQQHLRAGAFSAWLILLIIVFNLPAASGQRKINVQTAFGLISGMPSDMPSDTPSDMPSYLPSEAPSTASSSVVDLRLISSRIPTQSAQRSSPSSVPSTMLLLDVPSEAPSDVPSDYPSDTPTIVPTTHPTIEPTLYPSTSPSLLPSMAPSRHPSAGPTKIPSTPPSSVPSVAPTIFCHDEASYRSPINNFTCANHQGTDCTLWRFLGLDADGLQELVESCPVSCGIDCGSFQRFEIKVTFRVLNVPNFLDSVSVDTMEEASVEYLTNYVKAEEPASNFFLYEAELTSQQIQSAGRLGSDPSRRQLRRLQKPQKQAVDLLVTVAFRGFVTDLDTAAVKTSIVQGIDSEGYSRAIQKSGDPTFLDVLITLDVVDSTNPSGSQRSPKATGSGPSSGGKAAAAIVCLALVVVGLYCYVKKRHSWILSRSLTIGKDARDKNLNGNMNRATDANLSPGVSSVFSFEGNISVVSNLIRIMSSGSPRSNDFSTRSGDTSRPSSKETSLPSSEGRSSETTTSDDEEGEHPYTGLIPPMIVIDNIDEYPSFVPSPKFQTKRSGPRNVVPSQRIHASSELAAALRSKGGNVFDPTAFPGELFSHPMDNFFEMEFLSHPSSSGLNANPHESDSSAVSAAIPSLATADELDAMVVELDQIDTGEIPSADGLQVILPPRVPSRVGHSPSSQRRDASPRSASSVSFDNTASFDKERASFEGSGARHGSKEEDSTERAVAPTADQPKDPGGILHSFWSRRPSKGIKKSSSMSSLPDRAIPERSGSKGSGSGSSLETGQSDEPVKLTFRAPRKGKLGLVIECSSTGGPVVVRMKDYSPLLGRVVPGDKIAKIDGFSTINMSLSELTSLLSTGGKTSLFSGSDFQIVVLRSPSKNEGVGVDVSAGAASFDVQSFGGFSEANTSTDSFPFKI